MSFNFSKIIQQKFRFWCSAILIVSLSTAFSQDESAYISTTKNKSFFKLSDDGKSTNLFIDSKDFSGVIRALKDLKSDIGKVTNHEPTIIFDKLPTEKEIVIVGTFSKSPVIDQLVKSGKLDVKEVAGKWEAYSIQTIEKPFPGIDKALVIVGSDKRGTIYGIYDVSQKIGVSPWYFWADVPVEHKNALYVKPVKYNQSPSVKYRGIFINDEAPALTNWVKENYGLVPPSKNPPIGNNVANYGSEFYAKVFELMLRIKANYLWPAMWSNAFNEDDPENPRLADEYGIVMGNSHQEPMMRSQQEWDRRYIKTLGHWNYYKHPDTLQKFWRDGIRRNKNYENMISMGLRGANDSEIEGSLQDNIAMIEGIVHTQQQIIKEETGQNLNEIPQTWCLYKEILDYYNEGMVVPDNITLLWADDNWGNVRRLPTSEERKRSGGSGVYYHFDYHGGPRSYEWINTNPISKIWDQMALSKQYEADRIWIVNVGHFKGYELPMEYFMDLAWDTKKWTNSNINAYTKEWVIKQFGTEYADEITNILSKYTKFNGRRKPESLSPTTYSLVHYNEAENVVADYNKITAEAEAIYEKLPKEKRDAFYQIVLFPTKASALVNELYVTAAKNKLYAKQKRASTNDFAKLTRDLFVKDTTLMHHYNKIYADGKWDHFMDQTHLGYTSWNPPKKNSLDAIKLSELEIPEKASMGIGLEGSENSFPNRSEKAILPEFDIFNNNKHYIEIFNTGQGSFDYEISSDVQWISIDAPKGTIKNGNKRVYLSVNEAKLPKGKTNGTVTISGSGKKVIIAVSAFHPEEVTKKNLKGFVESGGVVSIEAEHFAKNSNEGERKWIKIEDYGLTLSGMRATGPVDAPSATPGKDAPCMEYPMHLFTEGEVEINLITSPLLNFIPGRDNRIAVSFDDEKPEYITNVPDDYKIEYTNKDWSESVVNQVRKIKTKLKINKKGYHTLKVWMIDPGVVVQKIIVNTGGLKESYLGPQESFNMIQSIKKP
ncbi:glycosyl hydrolase 115 family protein [Flavobacterium soli]|uniref:glycosyl hydrolase 115 family protein n=1 Tax=Flavobacterium soli TaxID=344881 RepID=UPI00041A8586|nr:glycosyl hydrolase 115 family protein [Flavobacterium soli]